MVVILSGCEYNYVTKVSDIETVFDNRENLSDQCDGEMYKDPYSDDKYCFPAEVEIHTGNMKFYKIRKGVDDR